MSYEHIQTTLRYQKETFARAEIVAKQAFTQLIDSTAEKRNMETMMSKYRL